MSDYLSRLAARSLDQEPVLLPRLASRYEIATNHPYRPFLPFFGWRSPISMIDEIDMGIEIDSSKNRNGEGSASSRELRSNNGPNRAALKPSRALYSRRLYSGPLVDQRSISRRDKQGGGNKTADEENQGRRQEWGSLPEPLPPQHSEQISYQYGHQRQRRRKQNLEGYAANKAPYHPSIRAEGQKNPSQGEDQTHPVPQKPFEAPLEFYDNRGNRPVGSSAQVAGRAYYYTVPDKAVSGRNPDGKKEILSYPFEDENGPSLKNRVSAKAGLKINSPVLRLSGLPEGMDEDHVSGGKEILNTGRTGQEGSVLNKSRGLINDARIIKIDAGAKKTPGKQRDSSQADHGDIFLENGMMQSPDRLGHAFAYPRAFGRKEIFGSKAAAAGDEEAGRPAASEPQIQVTIGRIEVRAVSKPKPTASQKGPDSTSSGLEEYLRKRSGGMKR